MTLQARDLRHIYTPFALKNAIYKNIAMYNTCSYYPLPPKKGQVMERLVGPSQYTIVCPKVLTTYAKGILHTMKASPNIEEELLE